MLQHVTTGRLRLPGYNFDYQFFQLMLLRLPAAAAAAAAAGTATDSASVIIPVILVASFSAFVFIFPDMTAMTLLCSGSGCTRKIICSTNVAETSLTVVGSEMLKV